MAVDRYIKTGACLFFGIMAALIVINNIANIEPARGFFVWATDHQQTELYPVTVLPVLGGPLITAALIAIIALETAAAVFLLWGSFRMFRARSSDAPDYRKAKTFAKIGLGFALLTWWGLFQAIAVHGYQIWQKPGGVGPDHGSWVLGAMAILVLIYLSLPEDG